MELSDYMEQSQVGLALEGVTVDYGAAKPALDNVTVSLKGGRIVGLLGANGAGKTTFINACAGVRTATSGKVMLRGGQVGWCAQQLMIDWFVSIRTNVWMGACLAGLTGGEAWDRADAALKSVGLDGERVQETPEILSGGQQQRLMIARVLAMDPKIMLLDEPTVGLDLGHINRLARAVRAARDEGALVVISSHDFTAIEPLIDDVLLLDRGTMRFLGPKADFVSRFAQREEISIELAEPLPGGLVQSFASEIDVVVGDGGRNLTITAPVGTALGELLRVIEADGGVVRDVVRRGVTLGEAFMAAIEQDNGSR